MKNFFTARFARPKSDVKIDKKTINFLRPTLAGEKLVMACGQMNT